MIVGFTAVAQKLPDDLNARPDGITIQYFDSFDTVCQPEIFIGNTLNILFPCSYRSVTTGEFKPTYKRTDISAAKAEISELRHLVTFGFLDSLERCCEKKGCPDTIHDYFLMK